MIEETAALVAGGAREITLLGQNVNSYRDPESGDGFAELLYRVAEIPDLWRLRFTTSHPKDLSPSLIEAMARIPQVMQMLHLPAQSGSDRILKAMNRGYTKEAYLEKVARLKQAIPNASLGGDMIVGFPGEDEDDFRLSMQLVEEARYDFLYSFIYSDRPFAKARKMEPKVGDELKKQRLAEMQDLQRKISLELHTAQVGKIEEVLVEGPAKKGRGLLTGRSKAGRTVNFAGSPELTGSLVQVEITEGRINSLMGKRTGQGGLS